MGIQEIRKNFIFPRIPLKFSLPEDYPDVGSIANAAVVPEITGFKFTRNELELEGNYQLAISYYKIQGSVGDGPPELKDLETDDFFSHLKLEADGLFAEANNEEGKVTQQAAELYTIHFSKPFHTFVDLEFINRPRTFRPAIVVENVELEPSGGRDIKGQLVLGLINQPRRSSW